MKNWIGPLIILVFLTACSSAPTASAPGSSAQDDYGTAVARLNAAAATPTLSIPRLLAEAAATQTAQALAQPVYQPKVGERSYFTDDRLYEWNGAEWVDIGWYRKIVPGYNNLVFDVYSQNEPGAYSQVDLRDANFIYVYYYKTETQTAIKRSTGEVYYKTGSLWLTKNDINATAVAVQATAVAGASSAQAATAQANREAAQLQLLQFEQRHLDFIRETYLTDRCGYYDPLC